MVAAAVKGLDPSSGYPNNANKVEEAREAQKKEREIETKGLPGRPVRLIEAAVFVHLLFGGGTCIEHRRKLIIRPARGEFKPIYYF